MLIGDMSVSNVICNGGVCGVDGVCINVCCVGVVGVGVADKAGLRWRLNRSRLARRSCLSC